MNPSTRAIAYENARFGLGPLVRDNALQARTGSTPATASLAHVEMSFGLAQAGFDTYDVHMSDLQAGRAVLARYQGLLACGGFNYGNTLGAQHPLQPGAG